MIHILDNQDDVILDFITLNNIIDDNHKKSLKDTLETYNFITFANKEYSQYLEKRNRIIIPDEDETLREFVIFEATRYKDSEGYKSQVFAHASYLELKKASVIYPETYKGTASQHGGRALNDTGWQIGIVEATGNITITIDKHTNPYAQLKRIAKEFDCELRFRIEHDGSKITGRYVDLLQRVGQWRGREAEFGRDLDGIRRVEKQDIVTALLGIGPEKENGEHLEVLVEDEDALKRWGRVDEHGNLKHLIEPYEIQSSDQKMTESEARQYIRTALNKRVNTQVTYETTIIDLENVPGMENKKIRFGDTIKIKDEKFNPPLYLEARVFEQTRSIKSQAKKNIKLGDFIEHTEEEVNAIWEQLRKEINNRLKDLITTSITSSEGIVFKNSIGSTDLKARVFLAGDEFDQEGNFYNYTWVEYDKNGQSVNTHYTKTITVTAANIDEKSTFEVEYKKDGKTLSIEQVTITNVDDGEDGEKGEQGEKGEKGKDGHTPIKGTDYFDGEDGQDGTSSYLWVRYSANSDGSNMTTNPSNAKYIGIATTQSPNAPKDKSDYEWSKIKGQDGIAGETGDDGKTSYLHIKYSDDGGNTFTSNNGEDVGAWIGTYVDFTQADSDNVNKYTWNKVKGEKGDKGDAGARGLQGIQGEKGEQGIKGATGADGKTSYTHIAYADTASGEGFSQNPSGKKYIGMYTDFTKNDSSSPSKYKWSLIKGADGSQGIPGPKGEDGNTPYFHTAWANNSTGTSGFSTTDSTNKLYIGTYTDFTQNDSTDPSKYKWTKIKGDKGDKGSKGDKGEKGNKGDTGAKGSKGDKGAKGDTGPRGAKGDKGEIGAQGPKGQQGVRGPVGPDGTTTYTWIRYADNANGGGFSNSPTGKKYIGFAFNKTSQTESTNPADYTWSLIQGPQGVKGNTGSKGATGPQGPNIVNENTVFGTKWLVANHIKSLEGLNVNDKFIVDNNGNVTFKGDLEGASGTFGEVTVTTGDFKLQDKTSKIEYTVAPKRNLINDHSFELLEIDGSTLNQDSFTYNWIGILDTGFYSDSEWEFGGSPKIATQYAPESDDALPIFGNKALVVNTSNYTKTYVYRGVGANSVYTASAYFKRQWKVATGGTPRIEIWHTNASGARLSKLAAESFSAVKSDYTVERQALTFTVPSNFQNEEMIEITLAGGNSKWVQVDGVQLVEGSYPTTYLPEDSIWEITSGNYRPKSKGLSLWKGARYMGDGQITTPDRGIYECVNGWVLEWQAYTPGTGARDYDYQYTHIPKTHAMYHSGKGIRLAIQRGSQSVVKYLYLDDTKITGHADNATSPNNLTVLSGVYEY